MSGSLAAEGERLDAAPDQRRQHAAQPLLVQGADHAAARRDRDRLSLLRDNDDDGVGLRADRQGRSVAHPVAVRCRTLRRLLEREEAGRRDDLIAPDNHRSVVQGRARHEDRGEELRGQLAVHRNAGLAVVLKPRRALEHDQRAVLRLTDEKSGSDEFVDDALHLLLGARREQAVEGAELSKLAQGAPQLRLEHDDQRDDGHGKQALQEQHREGQLEIGRDPVDEDEDQDTDEQLDRPGTADQAPEDSGRLRTRLRRQRLAPPRWSRPASGGQARPRSASTTRRPAFSRPVRRGTRPTRLSARTGPAVALARERSARRRDASLRSSAPRWWIAVPTDRRRRTPAASPRPPTDRLPEIVDGAWSSRSRVQAARARSPRWFQSAAVPRRSRSLSASPTQECA